MKLRIEKQQVTSLSNSEMETVRGGGKKRSDKRTGDCAFSRKHGVIRKKGEHGVWVGAGCYPKCTAQVAIGLTNDDASSIVG